METTVNIIAKSLFAKNSFDELTEEQLSAYTQQFPYTGIGHYLLAKKRKDKGEAFQESAAKASLYFNNPLILGYLLDGYTEEVEVKVPEVPEVPEVAEVEEVAEVVEEAFENNIAASISQAAMEAGKDVVEVGSVGVREAVANEARGSATPITVSEEPLFEPYHTIDYFASQGIKLKLEDLEKDKFGKQLRSFTDWLRAMKKIAPVATAAGVATDTVQAPSEAEIQKDAAESVEASDVETEAMAEVWIKQGKKARAAAIYRKLSLLNPAKSHYFAAKIDQLND